jgi:cation:H+ antiporter
MYLPVLLFILGIVILLVAANEFVTQSSLYSAKLRLSPLIIGTTVVAVGTSFPELVVSSISALKGDAGLALGNIVGSNIINILLVLGIAVLLGKIRVGTTKTQRNTWVMVATTFIFTLFHWMWQPMISGLILLSIFIVFIVMEIDWGIKGRVKEDLVKIKSMFKKPKRANVWLFLFSLLGVVGGGYITVNNAELISAMLGLSTTVFGLTATAITTSLPELIVTIVSERRGEEKIALGNILGSNICNLDLIGGLLFMFPKQINLSSYVWSYFIGSSLITLLIVSQFKGKEIPKWVGVGLLTLLFGYLSLMVKI